MHLELWASPATTSRGSLLSILWFVRTLEGLERTTHMAIKRFTPLALLAVSLLVVACTKESEEFAQSTGVLPTACGSPGARLQATIAGDAYCANGQVLATGDGLSVIVTGVSISGSTLVLQVDSIGLGTQFITEASNGLLYMESGSSYVVLPGQVGSITITQADTSARALKASFAANLGNEMSGQSVAVQGEVDVIWTESE